MNETKQKLTDFQLRIAQVIVGILSSAALIISIWVSSLPAAEDNAILKWLFLVVFLVVVIGRRKIEAHFQLRLNLYGLVLIDGILSGVIFYAVMLFYFPGEGYGIELNETLKLVIIAAVTLAMLIFGIILPLKKYFKRKEDGTLAPVRIEPKEEPEEEINEDDTGEEDGPLSIEQQISAMTKDLDKDKKDGQ